MDYTNLIAEVVKLCKETERFRLQLLVVALRSDSTLSVLEREHCGKIIEDAKTGLKTGLPNSFDVRKLIEEATFMLRLD